MTCTIRLWDGEPRLLATEHGCDEPTRRGSDVSITIHGDGPIREWARAMLGREAPSAWYMTIDFDLAFTDRITATVLRVDSHTRDCECGTSKIITTSLGGTIQPSQQTSHADHLQRRDLQQTPNHVMRP